MNGLDKRRYEMLLRVRDFGNSYVEMFPPSSIGGQAFAEVTAAIHGLAAHAADHVSGRGSAREGVTSKGRARAVLRRDIEAIVRTARAMSLDTPGLEAKFRPPRGSGDLTLLNTARAFARDAAQLEKQLLTYSMPDDFLATLNVHINEFEEAMRDREAGTEAHVAARAALDKTMEAALNAVRRLDAAVPNRLSRDAAALAVWTRARRLAASRKGAAPVVSAEHVATALERPPDPPATLP